MLVNIDFHIAHSMALVGQSGSGKSLTLKALLGMAPQRLHVHLDYEAPFALERGKSVGFVPQNPFTALSPLTRIRAQFFHPEPELFCAMVKLDPVLLDRYPPELSGGQLQRVAIAMALSHRPKLLLMDEPTTALDAATREQVLEMIKQLQEELGLLILFVTHDMHSAALVCQEIAILNAGEIVERGEMASLVAAPSHPYTKALLAAGFATRGFRQ
ncbi:MAG: ABC transporter ATP-binding protein [Campylobacterales bacterium]|nr:ABC transporter ATP-binding protein [Campylobacterales bacterium]